MALRPGAKNRSETTTHGTTPDDVARSLLRPRRRRFSAAIIAVPALLLLSSCSLLNGSSSSSSSASPAGGTAGAVEHPNITVGYLKISDSAPLEIAIQWGYFKQEGLNVTAVPVVSGTESVPKVAAGTMDIGLTNWATLFSAQEAKLNDFSIVADDAQGRAGTVVVATWPGSGITKISDLKGKTISTNATNDVPFIALRANLQANSIDVNSVHITVIHHPDTPQAMAKHEVDASIMLEPYLTQSAQQTGTRPVVDLFGPNSPTANLPLAGWFSTASFAKANPKTVAAFQRAMARGAADAADRKTVESIVPTFTTINKQTAALINLPTFPTTLDAKRLQRVADLMQQYGLLKNHLDVTSMVADAKPSS